MEDNGGPVFDSWVWGALCEACGHRTYRYAVEEDGELLACVPLVYMESRLFGDQLVSMPYSAYGSVVSREDAPEEVWSALDGSNRTHVRKARKEGVEYRQGTSREDLKRYYDLYLKNMRAFSSPPHSFSFFTQLWEVLGEHMVVKLALKDDRLINGQIRFFYGDRCFDWGGATDSEYRDLQGGSLLLWNGIEYACEAGYSTYTMGRTREGTGVYNFKKSWGGEKVWFDDYHYSRTDRRCFRTPTTRSTTE